MHENFPEYSPHYAQRFKKSIERFWEKVDRSPGQGPWGECWTWTAGCFPAGYGQFWSNDIGQSVCAHQFLWEQLNGPINNRKAHLCHRCDNPPCVRPSHLLLKDAKFNAVDRQQKGRANTPKGETCGRAKLKEEQVLQILPLIKAGQSHTVIGRQFSVSRMTITLIAQGKNWKHLQQRNEV